jgi:alkylation response protein AidB-like acyl-CoA dehydrogenase
VVLSTARADRVDGGYRISGHKMFGSLTPVRTRVGVHAMDVSDPGQPTIVHAFIARDADGIEIRQTWDTLGMRATRSDDALLAQVHVADEYIARVLPPGVIDPFIAAMFAKFELTVGAIYCGIAERAREVAVTAVRKRSAIGLSLRLKRHLPRRSQGWMTRLRRSSFGELCASDTCCPGPVAPGVWRERTVGIDS